MAVSEPFVLGLKLIGCMMLGSLFYHVLFP